MDEFVKKEEKTYIIEADSDENTPIIVEEITTEDVKKENEKDEELHEAPSKIEIVTGDAKDLDISEVSDYLEVEKPKEESKKGTIIIPEEKK